MAFKALGYDCHQKNLSDGNFAAGTVCVQLVSNTYNFSASHTTRADISTFQVGSPIAVTGKTVNYSGKITTYDCDDIQVTGSPSARWAVFLFWDGATAQAADKLISVVDLNVDGQVDVSIDGALQVSSSGILQTSFSNA